MSNSSLCLALATLPLLAQNNAPAEIESLMRQLHARGQFNGSVLVAQQGKILYRGSFGLADESSARMFNPDTASCLASLSKPFTALAIMMLAEKHQLNYEDRITKYFPELPVQLGEATIRQLLNHTSGIPDYSSDLDVDHPGITTIEVLNTLRTVNKPIFPPGQKYAYSNTGYVLLGLMVEKISGKPLPAYLQDRIFAPLGMKTTFALTAGRQKPANTVDGYDDFGSPK